MLPDSSREGPPGAIDVEVRRARSGDGPAYLELVRALAEFEKLPPPDPAACERLLAHAFADPPAYELWVAEVIADTRAPDRAASNPDASSAIAAYAVLFPTYSTFLARPTLFLEDLFVHPRYRRMGVATRVLARLRGLAEERGCGRFEWMVLDWNRDAIGLYERIGAEMHADWRLMRVVL